MNKKQVAKLNMGMAVKKLCSENQTVVEAVPAFADAVLQFALLMDDFVSYATAAKMKIQGVTQEKRLEKIELAKQTACIAGILYAYADKNSNLVLKEEVKVSKTELKRLPDNELPMVCDNIVKLAKDNVAEAGSFGLTQAKISLLEAKIAHFAALVPDPRMAISKRKTSNKSIEATIRQINNLLHGQMDKLVINLEEVHPDFVRTYFNDRMIINTAIRHNKKAIETRAVCKDYRCNGRCKGGGSFDSDISCSMKLLLLGRLACGSLFLFLQGCGFWGV